MVFRLAFAVDTAAQTTVHATADQRYELYLDGQRVGRGPMRGDLGHWQYESYDLALEPGDHLLAACAWWLPEDGAPMAQMYGDPGFLLLAEGPLTDTLSTGAAPWVASRVEAYGKTGTGLPGAFQVVGWSFSLDGHRYPWGWADAPAAARGSGSRRQKSPCPSARDSTPPPMSRRRDQAPAAPPGANAPTCDDRGARTGGTVRYATVEAGALGRPSTASRRSADRAGAPRYPDRARLPETVDRGHAADRWAAPTGPRPDRPGQLLLRLPGAAHLGRRKRHDLSGVV